MTEKSIETSVRELLELVLEISVPDGAPVSRDSEIAWTSLKHVELIFALEDAFNVRFSEKELPTLNSLSSFVFALKSHNVTI